MRYEDEVKGKAKQIKGTAKAELGKLTNDRDLESSGQADRAKGHGRGEDHVDVRANDQPGDLTIFSEA